MFKNSLQSWLFSPSLFHDHSNRNIILILINFFFNSNHLYLVHTQSSQRERKRNHSFQSLCCLSPAGVKNVIQPLKWTFFRRDKPVIQTFYLVFFSSTESSTDARKVKITAMEPHTTASGCRKAKIALSLNVIRGTIILIKVASNTLLVWRWSNPSTSSPAINRG